MRYFVFLLFLFHVLFIRTSTAQSTVTILGHCESCPETFGASFLEDAASYKPAKFYIEADSIHENFKLVVSVEHPNLLRLINIYILVFPGDTDTVNVTVIDGMHGKFYRSKQKEHAFYSAFPEESNKLNLYKKTDFSADSLIHGYYKKAEAKYPSWNNFFNQNFAGYNASASFLDLAHSLIKVEYYACLLYPVRRNKVPLDEITRTYFNKVDFSIFKKTESVLGYN